MSEPVSPETERLRRALATVVVLTFAIVSVMAAFCSKKQTGGEKATTAAKPAPPAPPRFSPFTATLDRNGRLWILDSANSRLSYTLDGGAPREEWGGEGGGNSSFRHPEGLAVSGDDLYVADTWNHRISHFTLAGEWKGAVSGFMGPRGVAVGKDGSVWVADTGNNRVAKYDAALKNGGVVGGSGSEPGEFKGPVGIAVGPSGTVYVTDSGNARIQALSSDGKFLLQWKVPWFEKTWMVHLEIGPDETIYVSNPDAGEIVSFSRTGTPGRTWKTAASGENLIRPVGLAVDREHGVLYVVDTAANRVSKIQLSGSKAR
jgi:tripartite motif-containing protein 71